jgi:hypothetical protein
MRTAGFEPAAIRSRKIAPRKFLSALFIENRS